MQDKLNEASEYSDNFIDHIDLHKFSIKNIIKFFYNYDAVSKLEKLIKKEKPDIAHLHNIAHQLTPAIINVLKKFNIPIVQTLHDYKLICPNAMLYNKNGECHKCLGGKYHNCFLNSCMHNSRAKSFLGMMEAYLNNKIYQNVDLFIAPSRFMKEVCVKFGLDEKRIVVLNNFLSDDWFKNQAPPDFVNTKNSDYLFYYGRLTAEKGVTMLIDAFAQSKNNDLKLVIAGTGPLEAQLKQKIHELALGDKISMIGFSKDQELQNIIKNAKAVLMTPLWSENMPYTLLESMALGKIVVSARVGGMPEMIQEGENGFLFQAGNTQELSQKIADLQKLSDEQLKQMSNNSFLLAKKLHKKQHYLEIMKHYTNILAKK